MRAKVKENRRDSREFGGPFHDREIGPGPGLQGKRSRQVSLVFSGRPARVFLDDITRYDHSQLALTGVRQALLFRLYCTGADKEAGMACI